MDPASYYKGRNGSWGLQADGHKQGRKVGDGHGTLLTGPKKICMPSSRCPPPSKMVVMGNV